MAYRNIDCQYTIKFEQALRLGSGGSTRKVHHITLFTGRMPKSGKLPVLNLLTGQNQHFRPAGATRCTDSRRTWRGRRAPVSAWLCKISHQSAQGVGNYQYIKNFHFLVKSCLARANPLIDFKNLKGYYTSNYPTLAIQI